ncbi:MAG: T9SS type A sorting domain-containing protein [Crocinitomicaceae bacterium]
MNKILLFTVASVLTSWGTFAQNVNIPDANFKAYLVGNSLINTNSDTEIQLSEATAFTGTIQASNLGISDLTGIEAFTNITILYCHINNLTALDVSQNTALTQIDASDNSLTTINLGQNQNLIHLNVYNNNLTALDVSQNTALTFLFLPNNNISSLDISQNTALEQLGCYVNNIGALDVSMCPNLVNLNCAYNNLTVLNMKNISTTTLTTFNATNNPNLTCIEVDNVSSATTNWTNIDATASFSLDCNTTAGMVDMDLSNSVFIYPNPAQSKIHINAEGIIESVKIIDIFGKTVNSDITNYFMIDVSELANGIYFLKISTNKGAVSKRFVKE